VAQLLPGVTLSGTTFSSQAGIDSVTSALAARVLGTNLTTQPAASTMTGANGELDKLIGTLCTTTSCNNSLPRVQAVTAAACAAALGSSDMLIN